MISIWLIGWGTELSQHNNQSTNNQIPITKYQSTNNQIKMTFTIAQIAALLGGEVQGDNSLTVNQLAKIEEGVACDEL